MVWHRTILRTHKMMGHLRRVPWQLNTDDTWNKNLSIFRFWPIAVVNWYNFWPNAPDTNAFICHFINGLNETDLIHTLPCFIHVTVHFRCLSSERERTSKKGYCCHLGILCTTRIFDLMFHFNATEIISDVLSLWIHSHSHIHTTHWCLFNSTLNILRIYYFIRYLNFVP